MALDVKSTVTGDWSTNQYVNDLLLGGARWNTFETGTPGVTVSWYALQGGETASKVQAFDVQQALTTWSNVANIHFVQEPGPVEAYTDAEILVSTVSWATMDGHTGLSGTPLYADSATGKDEDLPWGKLHVASEGGMSRALLKWRTTLPLMTLRCLRSLSKSAFA